MSNLKLIYAIIITLVVQIVLPSSSHAQQVSAGAQRAYKKALEAYVERDLVDTEHELEVALKKAPDYFQAWFLYAQIQRDLGRDSLAMIALEKGLMINDNVYQIGWLELAELNWIRGYYKKGLKALESFHKTKVFSAINKDKDLVRYHRWVSEGIKFSIQALVNPVEIIELEKLSRNINSDAPEYYPTMTLDGLEIVFTRRVTGASGGNGDEQFFNSKWENGRWGIAKPLPGINTRFNEGAPTISGNGTRIIFTACESPRDGFGDRMGKGSCDLFESQYDERSGNWTLGINLGAPNSGAWESQPTISADGNFLVFARAKHIRGVGSDLYAATRNEDGSWSKAYILPGKVNSPYEEESPYLHPDGKTLYFSSNGHPGLGGLDMFVSRRNENGEWGAPVNLGYPLNTFRDENSLMVEPDGKYALFATDRDRAKGDLDLWRMMIPVEARPLAVGVLSGEVVDDLTGEPLNAEVVILDASTGEKLTKVFSDVNTGFYLPLPKEGHYSFEVDKVGYFFKMHDFQQGLSSEDRYLSVRLTKIETGASISLNTVRFASGSSELEEGYQVDLIRLKLWMIRNNDEKITIIGHTDNVGKDNVNLELSLRRAESIKNFLSSEGVATTRINTEGKGSSQEIRSNDTEEGRAMNRRVEIRVD